MSNSVSDPQRPPATRAGSRFPAGPSLSRLLLKGRFYKQSTTDRLVENARLYGDTLSFRTPYGSRLFQFNHPEQIQDVLVTDAQKHHRGFILQRARVVLGEGLLTSEEPLHLRQRRLSQPAFHRQRIAGYGQTIVACTREMLDGWATRSSVEVHEAMTALTLRITGRCLLGTDVHADIVTIADGMQAFNDYIPFAILPFSGIVERLPIGPMPRIRKALAAMDGLIYGLIAERRRESSAADHDDLLAMLMSSVDTEPADANQDVTASQMNDKQVRDEALTILLAGHETTANGLTFCLWLLAKYPEVQERAAKLVDETLGKREVAAEDYPHLKYLEMIFSEAMRLYPPAWAIPRIAAVSYTTRSGVFIPKGSGIIVSQFIVHRDPRWWPDPMRFDPERFSDGAKANRPKFSFFPFGAGSRQCIGEGFVWMEAVLVLATILQHHRLSVEPDSPEVLEVVPRFTIRPKDAVIVKLCRR